MCEELWFLLRHTLHSPATANRGKPLTVHLHISDDFHQVVGSKIQWTFRAYPIFLVLWWASSANLYIETDYWKVKASLHWPYPVFCRSGVTHCHSTKRKFIPPERHVKQAGIKKHQNNHKFHRRLPWPPPLVAQVTTFTVKQPARFGFGRGGAAAALSTARRTAILSPGAGRSGERGHHLPRVTWMQLLTVDVNGFTAGTNRTLQGRVRWPACCGLQLARANAKQGSVLDMVLHLGAMASGGAAEPVVNRTQRSGSGKRWWTRIRCPEKIRERKPPRLMLVALLRVLLESIIYKDKSMAEEFLENNRNIMRENFS